MPTYEYRCPANGKTVEVTHAMAEQVRTWGGVVHACGGRSGQDTGRNAGGEGGHAGVCPQREVIARGRRGCVRLLMRVSPALTASRVGHGRTDLTLRADRF